MEFQCNENHVVNTYHNKEDVRFTPDSEKLILRFALECVAYKSCSVWLWAVICLRVVRVTAMIYE